MAENPSNHLSFLLEIAKEHAGYLTQIRHWGNLKIAHEKDTYWIKDFTQSQIESVEVKSIPFKQLYSLQNHLLFPYGSHLPVRRMTSHLLWTPMERGLPVTLPSYNHNFFGLQEKLQIKLVPSEQEQQPVGLLSSLATLTIYTETAPAIRLQKQVWVILNQQDALILGSPLLPIQGKALWSMGSHLLPTGYEFELPALAEVIQEKINGEQRHWVLWQADSSYSLVEKELLQSLSISSVRLSLKAEPSHL
ncbi:MAG: hypothetical protein ACO1OQ_09070 [Rufibacter sp.]